MEKSSPHRYEVQTEVWRQITPTFQMGGVVVRKQQGQFEREWCWPRGSIRYHVAWNDGTHEYYCEETTLTIKS